MVERGLDGDGHGHIHDWAWRGSSRMPEIGATKPVSLREAWQDEARHFTPWPAYNINLLRAKLGLGLDQV